MTKMCKKIIYKSITILFYYDKILKQRINEKDHKAVRFALTEPPFLI